MEQELNGGNVDVTKVDANANTDVNPVEPEVKQPTKNELMRELSKEYGVNLFDVDGIQKFKEYQESQKTEFEKVQEQLNAYKTKESEWQSKQLEYESKLKASELGIASDKLEDALRLANNNPDNLAEVIKKYPIFKSNSGIKIGQTDPNNNANPSGQTEVEKYMAERYAKNPYYKPKQN